MAGDTMSAGPAAPRQIAVVNAGASTLKLATMEVSAGRVLTVSRQQHEWADAEERDQLLRAALQALQPPPQAFGHRLVHGGARFVDPTTVTAAVEAELESLIPLAPLHNEPAVAAIRAGRALYPQVPAVAVFDTAFHAGRPAVSRRYALPAELVETFGVRRYGFHGIAHASLLEGLAAAQGKAIEEVSAVTLQLGAGCSACAVRHGRSLETSMGFTPLEGLVMATRCGDIDAAIVLRLIRAGYTADQVEDALTRRSGLLALCGSSDMRAILAAADAGRADAQFALELFCHRVVLTVGGYLTLLGGEGAVVFGGGIGSHAAAVRARVGRGLAAWGVFIDAARNLRHAPGLVSTDQSRPVYALHTDEESLIAREVDRHLG